MGSNSGRLSGARHLLGTCLLSRGRLGGARLRTRLRLRLRARLRLGHVGRLLCSPRLCRLSLRLLRGLFLVALGPSTRGVCAALLLARLFLVGGGTPCSQIAQRWRAPIGEAHSSDPLPRERLLGTVLVHEKHRVADVLFDPRGVPAIVVLPEALERPPNTHALLVRAQLVVIIAIATVGLATAGGVILLGRDGRGYDASSRRGNVSLASGALGLLLGVAGLGASVACLRGVAGLKLGSEACGVFGCQFDGLLFLGLLGSLALAPLGLQALGFLDGAQLGLFALARLALDLLLLHAREAARCLAWNRAPSCLARLALLLEALTSEAKLTRGHERYEPLLLEQLAHGFLVLV